MRIENGDERVGEDHRQRHEPAGRGEVARHCRRSAGGACPSHRSGCVPRPVARLALRTASGSGLVGTAPAQRAPEIFNGIVEVGHLSRRRCALRRSGAGVRRNARGAPAASRTPGLAPARRRAACRCRTSSPAGRGPRSRSPPAARRGVVGVGHRLEACAQNVPLLAPQKVLAAEIVRDVRGVEGVANLDFRRVAGLVHPPDHVRESPAGSSGTPS